MGDPQTVETEYRAMAEELAALAELNRATAPEARGSLTKMDGLLEAYSKPSGSPRPAMEYPPDEIGACPRCLRSLDFDARGAPVQHACCECDDTHRVRGRFERSDPLFGKALMCPACSGGEGGDSGAPAVSVEEFERRARIPARYRECRVDTWQPDNGRERIEVQNWLLSWPPRKPFLLLMGQRGTGKTHLACGSMRWLRERHGALGQFWNVVDLLERYKATFDDDRATETAESIDRQLDRVPVLCLDDFGAEQPTQWSERVLYGLVNRRYNGGLVTIVTTNAALGENRTTSRLADKQSTHVVQFRGQDRRLAG